MNKIALVFLSMSVLGSTVAYPAQVGQVIAKPSQVLALGSYLWQNRAIVMAAVTASAATVAIPRAYTYLKEKVLLKLVDLGNYASEKYNRDFSGVPEQPKPAKAVSVELGELPLRSAAPQGAPVVANQPVVKQIAKPLTASDKTAMITYLQAEMPKMQALKYKLNGVSDFKMILPAQNRQNLEVHCQKMASPKGHWKVTATFVDKTTNVFTIDSNGKRVK